jgi:hypothetical protein
VAVEQDPDYLEIRLPTPGEAARRLWALWLAWRRLALGASPATGAEAGSHLAGELERRYRGPARCC